MTQFVFNPTKTQYLLNGVNHKFHFANGYAASISRHDGSYGGPDGLWELAVIDLETGKLTDDVVGWLTREQVNSSLDRIRLLKPKNHEPTLIVLPFSGFYESPWEPNLVHHEDYPKWTLAYVKAYTEALNELLKEENFDLRLQFESIDSPKFYNFETDRIFATLDISDLEERPWTTHTMRTWCQKRHLSRPGFVSHYDPDHKNWGPVNTWDHNQLLTGLLATMEDLDLPTGYDLELELYERGLYEIAYEFETEEEEY